MPVLVGRRWFLAAGAASVVSAGAVSAGAIAACSRSSRPPQPGITVANHPLYIDADTNRLFTADTGIPVEYHEEIDDDDAWLASVQPRIARGQGIGRDVVIVADHVAARLERNGLLASPRRAIWALGTVGIAVTGSTQVSRITDLFARRLRGRVALPNDLRMTLGMALLADRVDPSTVSLDEATATAGRLHNSVLLGQVSVVDRPLDVLVAGDADAAVVRASDTVGLDVRFVVPEDGGLLLTDVAVTPSGGANPDGARRYLDFVDDPVHAADRYRVVPAVWPPGPVDQILEREAPAVPRDPRRNPTPDERARLRPFRVLDDDETAQFESVFASALRVDR